MTHNKTNIISKFKTAVVLLLCVLLMMPSQMAYASKYSEYASVELKDKSTGIFMEYEPVNLMISGIDIFTDAPGVVVGGRTIVPVSAILIELGVKYEWNGTTREISFSYGGKNVVMQVDNKYATINGTKTLLPDGVAPKIMTYKSITGEYVDRTYVPLKFISDVLGLSASWISDTRTVAINKKSQTLSGVYIKFDEYSATARQYPEIRFKLTGEVDVTSYVIDGADVGAQDKTIIDFQNTVLTPPSGSTVKNGIWTYNISDGIYGISKIEIAQTSTNPYNTRVTIYQNERRGNHIYYDAAKKEMAVQLINSITDVSVQEIYSTATVVIGTREVPNYNAQIVDNKIIVDVIDSRLKINNGAYQVLPVNEGKIEAISYSQLDTAKYGDGMYLATEKVTRVVVELTEEVTYDDFFIEDIDGNLYVYVANNPINNFNYVKQNAEKASLVVDLFAKTDYTTAYDTATRKLTVEIPKGKTDLGSFDQAINDHIIDKFVVSETSTTYKIEITLAENTTYTKGISSTSVTLNFTNTVIQNSEHKETLIVIDAGHGGKDPGAVGSKTQEKILTLKAAKMLESELLKQGFKVYMTRSTDEYVGLYDRAAMANDLNATLFVSVHINAFTSSSVSGIEVLYGNDSMTSDKGLATNIQKELISALGAVDRDIDSRPKLVVLKETTMTSVLCELGFITNPAEQDKLMTDSYLQKAANAMAKGIINFLK